MLEIDPEREAKRIQGFLKAALERLHKDGVVIGLSGGLNSSTVAFLAKEALGPHRIFSLILPEKDSDPKNIEHGREVAKILGVSFREIDITPILERFGVYGLFVERLPQSRRLLEGFLKRFQISSLFLKGLFSFYPDTTVLKTRFFSKYKNQALALATLKTRLRMVFLYYYARLRNYLVLGTSDKTEWSIGYYDGDVITDIQPLLHLYKTQIRELSRFCGVIEEILEKQSSGDFFGRGIPNETVIGLPYEIIDSILFCLERGDPTDRISSLLGIETEKIEGIRRLLAFEKTRRSLPLSLLGSL